MQPEQRSLTLEAFLAEEGVRQDLQVLASRSVAQRVEQRLAMPVLADPSQCRPEGRWLLVVGGGSVIDRAKLWRRDTASTVKIAAAASIWGSGAEASPIAVGPGVPKRIEVGEDLRPEVRVVWPELASHLPEPLVRWACGDVWSHALEGLLSPLAHDQVEADLASTVKALLTLSIGNDSAWFDLGARACALQARASVGLAHGIAHVLEPRLAELGLPALAAHARLCATLLLPVFRFNLRQSSKAAERLARHGISVTALEQRMIELHDSADFTSLIPAIRRYWELILRDPCTRTNVALVRKDAVDALINGVTA